MQDEAKSEGEQRGELCADLAHEENIHEEREGGEGSVALEEGGGGGFACGKARKSQRVDEPVPPEPEKFVPRSFDSIRVHTLSVCLRIIAVRCE